MLAKYASIAVDYGKSGIEPPSLSGFRITEYPDHMRKKNQISYKSNSILGKLYRGILPQIEKWNPSTRKIDIKLDEDLITKNWKRFEKDSKMIRDNYFFELEGLMNQFGVRSEEEIITGDIIKLHWFYQKKRHEIWGAREMVVVLYADIVENYVRQFWTYLLYNMKNLKLNEIDFKNSIFDFCSCWYMVTYQNTEKPFLSFPWLIYPILCKLKKKEDFEVLNVIHTDKIDEYISLLSNK